MLDDRNRFTSRQRGHMQDHQPQRAAADDRNDVAGARTRIFKAMYRAGQRLSQRCMLQRYMIGNMQRVLGDDARRDANEFRISAVVEEQIVAKVFLTALAKVALAAWRRVERHYAVARSKSR